MNLDAIDFPAVELGDDEQWAVRCVPSKGATRCILLGRELATAKRLIQLEFGERRGQGASVYPLRSGQWSVVTRVDDAVTEDRYTVVVMPVGVIV